MPLYTILLLDWVNFFCYILLPVSFAVYITRPNQFKRWKVSAFVDRKMVLSALILCMLLHSVCDLKAAQMNVERCLIKELIHSEWQLSYNAAEAAYNSCANGESLVDHSTGNKFSLAGFYGISTTVNHLMPNPLYTYISNTYDLVWLGFMAYQPL